MGNVKKPIDLLYILGTGSNWSNNEMRFSLRSVYKNLTGYRKIWIVGEDPGFLKGTNIIPHPDEIGPHNADGNITRKIIRACKEKGLSEHFLKMNDDYLIIKQTHAPDIYPMHKGDMRTFPENYFKNNHWRSRLKRTRDHIAEAGYIPLHFDHHSPMIISKKHFEPTVSQFDYASDIGLTTRSLYGSVMHPHAVKLGSEKKKVFASLSLAQIEKLTEKPHFLCYNDDGLNNSLRYWLGKNFPDPSPWEIGDVEDRMVEIAKWESNGRDYKTGAEIFVKYFKLKNLGVMFNGVHTPVLEAKLNFKINQTINEL
jgi:hypothetical protein